MKVRKIAVLASAFAFTIYATSYISKLPESNCTTSEVSSLSSDDRFYKATLLRKECNVAETIFYSVKVDKLGGAPDRRWFTTEDIQPDSYPAQPSEPVLKWNSHRLEIEIPAKNLNGAIERSVEDLKILRSYVRPNS